MVVLLVLSPLSHSGASPACEDTVSPPLISRARGDVDRDKDRWRLAFASKTGVTAKLKKPENTLEPEG